MAEVSCKKVFAVYLAKEDVPNSEAYIRNQLEEDYAADQISIKEYVDPFTGDKNKKA